jgi:hypothetical protein
MTLCCDINSDSPCTIDEAVKTALVDAGVLASIHSGALVHQDEKNWPVIVFELLQPSLGKPNGCCLQFEAVLQMRIYSTTKREGVELAGTVLSVLKDRQPLQSLSGNFMVFKHTIPQQLELPDGIFMTKANYSLVIVTPK